MTLRALTPALALFLVLGLAACEPADPAASAEPAEPAAAETAAPAATAALPGLLVEADGITPAQPGGGTALKLSFGQFMNEVIGPLAQARGGAPAEITRNTECGAGPLEFASWDDGLQLVLQEGRFVGWWLDQAAPETYSTVRDVHVGSTLRELRAAYPDAEIRDESIGPEFTTAEGLSGTLSGTADEARITNLYAGVSCIFR